MSNPFSALYGLVDHNDADETPVEPGAEDSASNNCHKDVYHLQIKKIEKIRPDSFIGPKLFDNSAILQLPREERQERFENAVQVKLGQPWDRLAHQISLCREDYADNDGNEDPGFYRRRRFKRQTQVSMNELPTDKFYFQAQCCARTPISKQSLNEFAEIAEFYGFGVKKTPVDVYRDIELEVKQKEEEDSKDIYIGGQIEKSLSDNPNRYVLGITLEDGSLYRFTQTEHGQKIFRDKGDLWLCNDSKEPMTPETFLGQKHSWILYKQNPDNKDVYLPQGVTKQFTIELGAGKESLIQTFEDGTRREITSDGVIENEPVKSGS
jgi:hypothetical protein